MPGYGSKDGSQQGQKKGGGGRNRTETCRHPETKAERKESK